VDRAEETRGLYDISVYNRWDDFSGSGKLDCLIISVPPAFHNHYISWAIDQKLPCFVEASVISEGLEMLNERAEREKVLIAPSCTLRFHPAVRCIREWVKNEKVGKISNVVHVSGQFLPDWHVYESVSEYYVSAKETGGAREIVPFELTWILDILGWPDRVSCMYGKTIDIEGASAIDDTYNILLQFQWFFMSLTVDVVSRKATRQFLLNGSQGQIKWDWDERRVSFYGANNVVENFDFEAKAAHQGYNPNITEEMYEQEMAAFIAAVKGVAEFPNSLRDDIKILRILERAEASFNSLQIMDLN
jgi:predicted dehydrogenase